MLFKVFPGYVRYAPLQDFNTSEITNITTASKLIETVNDSSDTFLKSRQIYRTAKCTVRAKAIADLIESLLGWYYVHGKI